MSTDVVSRAGVVTVTGAVATLWVGDGTHRNALSREQWEGLREVAGDLADRSDVTVVVVRGTGSTFCAGFRIDGWDGASSNAIDADFAAMEAALRAVEAIPVPTVAVLEGVAAGAGCQLALACDVRIASSSASIGMPILRLGILCSPAFTYRLTALTGPARGKELLFTGRLLPATVATGYGLVSQVSADEQLEHATADLVGLLLSQPRAALVAAKRAVGVDLDARRRENDAPDWRFSGPDFPERVRRFLTRKQ